MSYKKFRSSLPLRDRMVMVKGFEGKSFREIGEDLDISGQRAYIIWHRTVDKLFAVKHGEGN